MKKEELSLNLVLKKKGSPHAFESVRKVAVSGDLVEQEKAYQTPLFLGSKIEENADRTQTYILPPDVSEEVPRTINQELADATPPAAALQAFPDWSALLVKSTVLSLSVWVVRDRRDGEEIARETGQPALLLDDVLRQQGKTATEARAALLPLLITGTAH